MTLDDAIYVLRHGALGGHVEVAIFASPAVEGSQGPIAAFSGELTTLDESLFREGEFDLRIQLSNSHKTPHGRVTLRRETIWQRGFRISIEVYGPAATSDTLPAEQLEDDVPF
jgi:hypothetical protein